MIDAAVEALEPLVILPPKSSWMAAELMAVVAIVPKLVTVPATPPILTPSPPLPVILAAVDPAEPLAWISQTRWVHRG
jgi:hypothetical protein